MNNNTRWSSSLSTNGTIWVWFARPFPNRGFVLCWIVSFCSNHEFLASILNERVQRKTYICPPTSCNFGMKVVAMLLSPSS
ncbi:hypothetical protein MtrunA17_Chr5g0406021 [Medicago truncatula]|uniref:Uncharacterized protein n=1 Tax=Medicago truncatula TaxID=3880 RepID=A0A396HSK2_MEDTR|nr:hypothetical protein MtrunA17_Chr5g0406021 [Medicago truncatula]